MFFSGFSHDDLIEPIAVAVNNNDEVLIADNGVGSILVFESCGKLKKKIGRKGKNKGEFKELSSVCIGPKGEIIVADTRIVVFSPSGEFLREIGSVSCKDSGARGRYCGVSVDRHGHLLAARMEKTKSYIQVKNIVVRHSFQIFAVEISFTFGIYQSMRSFSEFVGFLAVTVLT